MRKMFLMTMLFAMPFLAKAQTGYVPWVLNNTDCDINVYEVCISNCLPTFKLPAVSTVLGTTANTIDPTTCGAGEFVGYVFEWTSCPGTFSNAVYRNGPSGCLPSNTAAMPSCGCGGNRVVTFQTIGTPTPRWQID